MQAEGKVPTFFCSVYLVVESLSSVQVPRDMPEDSKAQVREYLRIPGALISFIGGDAFPARTIKDHAPPEDYIRLSRLLRMSSMNGVTIVSTTRIH
jgi:hypothetical protein